MKRSFCNTYHDECEWMIWNECVIWLLTRKFDKLVKCELVCNHTHQVNTHCLASVFRESYHSSELLQCFIKQEGKHICSALWSWLFKRITKIVCCRLDIDIKWHTHNTSYRVDSIFYGNFSVINLILNPLYVSVIR